MRLLDDSIVLSPSDLHECEFALVRRVAELRHLAPIVEDSVFMADRVVELTGAHEERVRNEYQRTYSRMFVDLAPGGAHAPPRASRGESRAGRAPVSGSLAELRDRHRATVEQLRSLRAVSGGGLLVDVAPGVLLHSEPVILLPGAAADTVLDRFARAPDLARLGGHLHALELATERPATSGFLHLNNDRAREYPAADLLPIARARLRRLGPLLAAGLTRDDPWPWGDATITACGFCARCKGAAAANRDVQLVWGMRPNSREALRRGGVRTIDELAATTAPPGLLDPITWELFRGRARLQLEQEDTSEKATPPAQPDVTSLVHDPKALETLPDPDPGDIFFDFEGDPFWVEKNRWEWGLEYLFGFIEADTGEYVTLWAGNQREEKVAFTKFLKYLKQRRSEHPGMHIYHFAFYEPATMRRLARRHRTEQQLVTKLIEDGVFVDLYGILKAGVSVSQRSYGLKALEPLYMGDDLRGSEVTDGGAAVVAFEAAVAAKARGDEDSWRATLEDLADYNRYDCESTRRLRDWLLAQRSAAPGSPASGSTGPDSSDPGATERGTSGEAAARDLLGATPLESELLVSPLEVGDAELSQTPVRVPGFDEVGIFYVFSGTSTDALGATHKQHELLGRWGSGSPITLGASVLVIYHDPATARTSSVGLVPREATVLECELIDDHQRIVLREETPAHDPSTRSLVPSFLQSDAPTLGAPTRSAPKKNTRPPASLLKAAKKLTYTVITGPPGSGKTALAHEIADTRAAEAVVVDDAHQVSLADALARVEAAHATGAETGEAPAHVIVAGDPTLATPVPRRGLPGDLAAGPLLSWILGDSGAKVQHTHALTEAHRFHPTLAAHLRPYLYPDATFTPPPQEEPMLVPEHLSGLQCRAVSHRGNTDSSAEEAAAVRSLVKELLAASPLTESDVLITAVYDAQVLRLRRELAQWPELRIAALRDTAGQEAAVSILSIGASTLTSAPVGLPPLSPHRVGAALTRAREAAFIVCASQLLGEVPPRGEMFADAARFSSLLEACSPFGQLHP